MQSALSRHHNTETALIRVGNDILRAVDVHQEAALVLLDLPSAFDTFDHDTLIKRLRSMFVVWSGVF